MLAGVLWVPATYTRPGEVISAGAPAVGVTWLGAYPAGSHPRLAAIAGDLRAAGFEAQVVEDITRWKAAKLLGSVTFVLAALYPAGELRDLAAQVLREEAREILTAAGYKLGANGMFSTPTGQPLNIDVKVVASYTDYLSILQILQPELKAAGINLQVTSEAYSVWATDQDTGNFQLLLSNAGYTPIPYSFYYSLLDSAVTKPIGTSEAVGDYGRYNNPQVNSLLSTIAGTTNVATQNQAFYQIESIFKSQLPDIPLMEAQDEIEFNGNAVTGFPTTANPYAAPATWLQPDDAWVAARLSPAK